MWQTPAASIEMPLFIVDSRTNQIRSIGLLTEAEIHKSFRALFAGGNVTEETLSRGEQLLDELRPESPLRHRLATELEELRKLVVSEG